MIGGKLSCYISTVLKYGAQINTVGCGVEGSYGKVWLYQETCWAPISHCQVGYLPPEHTLQHQGSEGLSVPDTRLTVRHAEYTNAFKKSACILPSTRHALRFLECKMQHASEYWISITAHFNGQRANLTHGKSRIPSKIKDALQWFVLNDRCVTERPTS